MGSPHGGRYVTKPFRITRVPAVLVFVALLAPTVPARALEQDPEYPAGTLDLLEVVRLTLKRDPNITLARETVRQYEGAFQQASGAFDNTFTFGQSVSRTSTTYVSNDPTVPNNYSIDTTQSSLSSSWLLRTGQTLTPQIGLVRSAYADWLGLGTQNTGSVTFGITQPLLRGRGRAGVTAAERSAELTLQSNALTLRHTISERIRNAAIAYFNFVAARENLDAKVRAEDNARATLDATRKLAEAGEQARADVVPTEADFLDKRAARVQAEQALSKARFDLGTTIGLPQDETRRLPLPAQSLPKIDLPSLPGPAVTERYVREALDRRLDRKAREAARKASEALLDGSRDAMRPKADLQLSAGYQGFTSGWGFKEYFTPLKPDGAPLTFSASFSVLLPTKNTAARGAFVAQEAIVRQNQVLVDELSVQVGGNVASVLADLRRDVLQHESAARAAELYAVALANDQVRLKRGVTTVSNVILTRNYAVAAILNELTIRLNIIRSLVDLRFETGTILSGVDDTESVDIEHIIGIPFPAEAQQ
jgi:outer membrane protein TolC